MDKTTFLPNNNLLYHLDDYGISQRDIARFRNTSDAAVSKIFKTGRFTLQFIDDIAELGGFSLGCFQTIEGQQPMELLQENERCPVIYRIYLLIYDLVYIYKSFLILAEKSGINIKTLRMMKKHVEDVQLGLITPPQVLAKIQFSDYLKLLNLMPYPDQGRYIIDPNGPLPMPDTLPEGMMPKHAYINYKNHMESKLHDVTLVAEELSERYNEMCEMNKESVSKTDDLRQRLNVMEKQNDRKDSMISGKNADIKVLREVIYKEHETFRRVLTQMKDEKKLSEEMIQSMINMIEEDHKKIKESYGNKQQPSQQ